MNKAEEFFKDNFSEIKSVRDQFIKSKRIKNKTYGNMKKYIYKKTKSMPSILMMFSLNGTYKEYYKLRF